MTGAGPQPEGSGEAQAGAARAGRKPPSKPSMRRVPTSPVVRFSITLNVTKTSVKVGDGLAIVASVESTDTLWSDSDSSE